jgi:hypothetical protein
LEHAERPLFNLIGSWTQADMKRELELWASYARRRLDTVDVVEEGAALLDQRFGQTHAGAIARAADLELAAKGLPIWSEATDSLVPQSLEPWRIYAADDGKRESPGVGLMYRYCHASENAPLTLYLYNAGLCDIKPGIDDSRFAGMVRQTLSDIDIAARSRGDSIEWLTEPLVTKLGSERDLEVQFVSSTWMLATKDGEKYASALSIRGFRGHLLKIRMTGTVAYFDSDTGQTEIDAHNMELVEFVQQLGP